MGDNRPPGKNWQRRGHEFVAYAQGRLWGGDGDEALAWLRAWGLSEEIAHRFNLGYNASDWYDEPARWGMDGERKIWLPRGVVIPCGVDGMLWYLKIKRPPGEKLQYIQVRGGRWALFGADDLNNPGRALLLCANELDALLATQELGDLADVAAFAWASRGIPDRWLSYLLSYACIMIVYAGDASDHKGAITLVSYGKRVIRLEVLGGDDLLDFHQAGGDLRAWLDGTLSRLGYQPGLDQVYPAARTLEAVLT